MEENVFEAMRIVNVDAANALAHAFSLIHYYGRSAASCEDQLFAMLRFQGGQLGAWLDGKLFKDYQDRYSGLFLQSGSEESRANIIELHEMAVAYRETHEEDYR